MKKKNDEKYEMIFMVKNIKKKIYFDVPLQPIKINHKNIDTTWWKRYQKKINSENNNTVNE